MCTGNPNSDKCKTPLAPIILFKQAANLHIVLLNLMQNLKILKTEIQLHLMCQQMFFTLKSYDHKR